MNNSRFEAKVGLFVAFGLAVSVLLILNFSKGITLFQSVYHVHVVLPTVSGLKPAADVMLAGVPIGKVSATDLNTNGRTVDVTVEILSKFKIHNDATFHIDTQGILGDQYVEVTPVEGADNAPFLKEGDTVIGEAPFNMQEAVRSVAGLLDQARKTMKDIDQSVNNVNNTVLAGPTLANFATAVSNFEAVTAGARDMATEVRGMIDSNGPPVFGAVTNFKAFSQKLNGIADQLSGTLSSNSGDVTEAVRNFRDTSVSLKQLAEGLQAGQGIAGALLKDETMKAELGSLITNVNSMSEQFGAFGQRLNKEGIWRTLWKPKPDETNAPQH